MKSIATLLLVLSAIALSACSTPKKTKPVVGHPVKNPYTWQQTRLKPADIERVRTYNEGLAFIEGCEESHSSEDPRFHAVIAAKRLSERDYIKKYRPITIHRIFPTSPLGDPASLLNFDPRFLRESIERGFDDALNHDCAESNCVIPD